MYVREFFVSCSYFSGRRFSTDLWHYVISPENRILLVYSDDETVRYLITEPYMIELHYDLDDEDRKKLESTSEAYR